MAASTASTSFRFHIVSRTAAAVLGGYAFTWGVVAFGTALLFAAGMAFHDAEHLAYIVGFLVYLVAFLVSFAARSLPRVWLVLAGGGASLAVAASLLQQQLV
ncbi:iron uptake protein [Pseudoduganella lutea]|uniref:Iron uptake protein n=1 Tax=Pseudoduganella lutea TaxID=321985 RepID=A0A4P6L3M7_9BURK|nr:iron uptake protein [Pseudoduganella lutea]QBE66256.1 iron uptake protein [Pseudoduganella lutea]